MSTLCRRARTCARDYARNSSVHGVRHVADENTHAAHKVLWAFILLLSLGLCVQQIYNMWLKWTYAPVIVSFDERSTPVWEIPFPAVTICTETKARQRIFNFTLAKAKYGSKNISSAELNTLSDVSLLCEQKQFVEGTEFTSDDVIELFRNMSPAMDETLEEVLWCKSKERLFDLFTPIVIGEGICFSFNMLDPREIFTDITEQYKYNFTHHGRKADEWSTDSGYAKAAPVDTYPRRALGAGYSTSLAVMLRSNTKDIDYMCKGPVPGFRILLHNPAELPWVSQHFLRSDLNQELVVSVRPYMITTKEDLQHYSPHVRQCLFPSERQLKYFRVYTQNNCLQECLTDFTLQYCGCVGFYMPRTSDMKMCGSGKRSCMADAAGELMKGQVEQVLGVTKSAGQQQCNCLPSCTDIQYNGETSTARFSWKEMLLAKNKSIADERWHSANIGRVVVFFKESHFVKHIRDEAFGAPKFWANCGGLLGLFLGMSVLSILEMAYYLVVRFWVNPENKRRSNKLSTTDKSYSFDYVSNIHTVTQIYNQ